MQTQEFLVLGSQTLSDLRDNIYCLTDKLMQTAEQHDPSGYFLIEVCGLFVPLQYVENIPQNLPSLAGYVLQ